MEKKYKKWGNNDIFTPTLNWGGGGSRVPLIRRVRQIPSYTDEYLRTMIYDHNMKKSYYYPQILVDSLRFILSRQL